MIKCHHDALVNNSASFSSKHQVFEGRNLCIFDKFKKLRMPSNNYPYILINDELNKSLSWEPSDSEILKYCKNHTLYNSSFFNHCMDYYFNSSKIPFHLFKEVNPVLLEFKPDFRRISSLHQDEFRYVEVENSSFYMSNYFFQTNEKDYENLKAHRVYIRPIMDTYEAENMYKVSSFWSIFSTLQIAIFIIMIFSMKYYKEKFDFLFISTFLGFVITLIIYKPVRKFLAIPIIIAIDKVRFKNETEEKTDIIESNLEKMRELELLKERYNEARQKYSEINLNEIKKNIAYINARLSLKKSQLLSYYKNSYNFNYSNQNQIKGKSENEFVNILKKYFGGNIVTDVTLNNVYYPDIVFFDSKWNIYIDIEIDEPYDEIRKFPTHIIGSDDQRDNYFLSHGWTVIRFSELQVIRYPLRCVNEINELLKKLTLDELNLVNFPDKNMTESNFPQKRWSFEEANFMSQNNVRQNY